jgi:hypothetical protein
MLTEPCFHPVWFGGRMLTLLKDIYPGLLVHNPSMTYIYMCTSYKLMGRDLGPLYVLVLVGDTPICGSPALHVPLAQ